MRHMSCVITQMLVVFVILIYIVTSFRRTLDGTILGYQARSIKQNQRLQTSAPKIAKSLKVQSLQHSSVITENTNSCRLFPCNAIFLCKLHRKIEHQLLDLYWLATSSYRLDYHSKAVRMQQSAAYSVLRLSQVYTCTVNCKLVVR